MSTCPPSCPCLSTATLGTHRTLAQAAASAPHTPHSCLTSPLSSLLSGVQLTHPILLTTASLTAQNQAYRRLMLALTLCVLSEVVPQKTGHCRPSLPRRPYRTSVPEQKGTLGTRSLKGRMPNSIRTLSQPSRVISLLS